MNFGTREGLPSLPLLACFCAVSLILVLAAFPPALAQEWGRRTARYRVVKPRAGEICIVCDKPIGATDRVYEVEGRRVPVHRGVCEAALAGYPERFLARLKPRGAFLGAEPNLAPNISWGWFALGVYVLLGLLFGASCAYRAVNHALSPWPWFLAGFFLNLLGFLALVLRPAGDSSKAPAGLPLGLVKVPNTSSPMACPRCGAMNHPSATACAECGNKIEPQGISEVTRAGLRVSAQGGDGKPSTYEL
jgi:hypothetical protein